MSRLSTHVLDTAQGCPAAGLELRLERELQAGTWELVSQAKTNADGRVSDLLNGASLAACTYRLHFATEPYHRAVGGGFFPYVEVVFTIKDPTRPYHVPLLLSPYGFSTYRGS